MTPDASLLPRTYGAAVAYCESLLRAQTGVAGGALLAEHFQRMGYFLERMGAPQRRFASAHVAGTSGKGSTSAMIGAILRAAGLRTGVHCTPYLQTPIERMQVGELYASTDEFVRLVQRLQPHILHMQQESPYHDISYREIAVAQAFLHFANAGVDVAAIETGMGGRFDYTNHIQPLVSIIVTVDYDHVATLGPTLERIARHKAGIIKDGVPAVTGVTEMASLAVIEQEAALHHAPLYRLGREIGQSTRSVGSGGSIFDYRSPWGPLDGLRVGMLGRHQITNAALAATAAHLLGERGLPVTDDAIRRGLAAARMPGRLEVIQQLPTVVLDGAHNPEKMRSLAAGLHDLFPGRRPTLVVGVLAAKQADEVLAEVVPLAATVIVTSPLVLGKPAVPADHLADVCRRLGGDVVVEPDLQAAMARAQVLAGDHGLICVTGSLYMVGQARELWAPTARILAQRTSFPGNTNHRWQ